MSKTVEIKGPAFFCKICLKHLTRSRDHYYVDGNPNRKFDVAKEIEYLPFKLASSRIGTAAYCCYDCQKLLKKRHTHRKALERIDDTIYRLSHGVDPPEDVDCNISNKYQNKVKKTKDKQNDEFTPVIQNVTSLASLASSVPISSPSFQVDKINNDSKVRIIETEPNRSKEHNYCDKRWEKSEKPPQLKPIAPNIAPNNVIICVPTTTIITNMGKAHVPMLPSLSVLPAANLVPGPKKPRPITIAPAISTTNTVTVTNSEPKSASTLVSTVPTVSESVVNTAKRTKSGSVSPKKQPQPIMTRARFSIMPPKIDKKDAKEKDKEKEKEMENEKNLSYKPLQGRYNNCATQTKECFKDLPPPIHGLHHDATTACIYVKWPSSVQTKALPGDLTALGISLLRGRYNDMAKRVWAHDELKSQILQLYTKDLMKEADTICSEKVDSILRKDSPEDILNFTFEKFDKEMQDYCPHLRHVLKTVATRKNYEEEAPWLSTICIAASLCLKIRQPKMYALQKMLDMLEDGEKDSMPLCLLKYRYIFLPTSEEFFFVKKIEIEQKHYIAEITSQLKNTEEIVFLQESKNNLNKETEWELATVGILVLFI